MNKLNRKCKQCGREWSCIPRKYGKEPCDSDLENCVLHVLVRI